MRSTNTVAGDKIEWFDPCMDAALKTTTVVGSPQTSTLVLPGSGQTTGGGNCDTRGDWQVQERTSADSFQAQVFFRVHDPAHAAADLTTTGSANVTQPNVDNAIIFFATNQGPDAVSNAQVAFTVPSGMTFGSFTGAAGWTCPASPTNGVVTCSRATLPARALGSSAGDLFTLHATTPATAAQSQIFTSVGTISSDTHELNPVTNTTVVDLTVNSGGSTGASINRGSGSVTNESCPQAGVTTFDNGQVDPGELVTVSFTIVNNSLTAAGDVTGLVGTLRTTGGVTNPSGTLNFGNVPHNSLKAASVSFTAARVDCGSILVASIDMTDSVHHNLGTVVFQAPMGERAGTGNDDVFACCNTIASSTTTITGASPSSPSTFGQPVTFAATVTPSNSPLATGNVTFKDGATTLGTGALNNVGGVATATFQTSATQLAAGAHALTAVYAGDSNYTASTSAGFPFTVNPVATTTSVGSSLNPSQVGQNVTFTATVSSGAGTPTGTVQFVIDSTNAGGPVAMSGGVATLSTPSLSAGTHTVSASYGGASNFAVSNASLAGGQVVNAAPTPTPAPTATPTTTPSQTPTATPAPTTAPARPLNISTRLRVGTGENVLIGGFIITGTDAKKIIVRGLGPSLFQFGIIDFLADPMLELHGGDGSLLQSNDNWKDTQQPEIEATGVPPSNDLESAIVTTLQPGNATAIVRGQNDGVGVGLLEIFDLDQAAHSQLANISARAFVETGDNVLIGGFILGGSNTATRVIIRAIGPSLLSAGIVNALADPTLELHDGNGALLQSNDNWKDTQQAEIEATGVPPTNDLESAIVATLQPGNYTAVVAGKNGGTGVALAEVFNLGQP